MVNPTRGDGPGPMGGIPGSSDNNDGAQGAAAANLGEHTVSSSPPNAVRKGLVTRIGDFFRRIFGRSPSGSSSSSSSASLPTSTSPSMSSLNPQQAPSASGARVKRPAPQPPEGIASRLKREIAGHEAGRPVRGPMTASQRLQAQWTNYENTDLLGYRVHGVSVLMKGLEASLQDQIFMSSTGIPLPEKFDEIRQEVMDLLGYASRNIEMPSPVVTSSSALLKTFVSMVLEGPHLRPEVSMVDFIKGREEDFNVTDSADPFQGMMPRMLELAGELDAMRSQHPGSMPNIWASLTRQVMATLNRYGNGLRSSSAGKYDIERMKEEVSTSWKDLKEMNKVNHSAYLNTLNVLTNDVIVGKHEEGY
ncbi:hypothetical protein CPE2_0068 [Chlamydia pecorum W73]|uniref:SemD/SinC family type III secretion system effector n=1 Tax=Chlamydia pecorum TaxID=85991 RepID=UPI0003ADAEBC|nr:hypothetical protein [Chlamydia pecorum]AGW38496.1 hypothetical protein CPE2_0068 [Chlamydia pecorum W73]